MLTADELQRTAPKPTAHGRKVMPLLSRRQQQRLRQQEVERPARHRVAIAKAEARLRSAQAELNRALAFVAKCEKAVAKLRQGSP